MNFFETIWEKFQLRLEALVNRSLQKKRSKIKRIFASVITASVSFVIAYYAYMQTQSYYTAILIFGTILIFAFGGTSLGILFCIILAFIDDYFFISPVRTVLSTPEEVFRFFMFLFISSTTSLLIASSSNALVRTVIAKQEAERAKQELEKELFSRQEREARLQRILTGINDGYFEWNPKTDDAFHPLRWNELLGYAPSELPQKGRSFFELIHPEDAPMLDKTLVTSQPFFNKL